MKKREILKFKLLLLPIITVIIIVMIGISNAAAINLGIQNSSLKFLRAIACTSANINVGANASYQIAITDIPASCWGKSLSVQIIASDAPTTMFLNGITSSHVVFSNAVINPATITQVKVAISGWQVPAIWIWDTPALYVDASTPNVSISSAWTYYSATSFCVTSTISTTSSSNISWVMNLVSNKYPFNGDINTTHYVFSPSGNYDFTSPTPTNGIFKISGSKVSTGRVKAGAPQNVTICNSSTPLP